MSNIVRYKGETTRGPSVALWGDVSKLQDDQRAGRCSYMFEDFRGWSTHTVNTNAVIQAGQTGGWQVLADAGVLVNPIANSIALDQGEAGVLVIADADADNDEAYLSPVYPQVKFDATYGYRSFFEARVKVEAVSGIAILAGFALKSDIAAALIADDTTGLVATANFVGFQTLDAAASVVRTTYQKVSQTQQVIASNAATLVAATWHKLGFLYNPVDGGGKAIRFFFDGVELPDYATVAQVSNTTLFPDDISMVPFFGFKIDGTGNLDGFVDWISWAQYFE